MEIRWGCRIDEEKGGESGSWNIWGCDGPHKFSRSVKCVYMPEERGIVRRDLPETTSEME